MGHMASKMPLPYFDGDDKQNGASNTNSARIQKLTHRKCPSLSGYKLVYSLHINTRMIFKTGIGLLNLPHS